MKKEEKVLNWTNITDSEFYEFGDFLAKQEYYDPSLRGMDAICYYLVHHFNWTPHDVRSMSISDIKFVLQNYMVRWLKSKGQVWA